MADSQVPWGLDALNGAVTEPAWRVKPSWYLVSTDDRMIPPPAQRAMSEHAGATLREVAASHSIYVSQPEAVAAFIINAADAIASSASWPDTPAAEGAVDEPLSRPRGDDSARGLTLQPDPSA